MGLLDQQQALLLAQIQSIFGCFSQAPETGHYGNAITDLHLLQLSEFLADLSPLSLLSRGPLPQISLFLPLVIKKLPVGLSRLQSPVFFSLWAGLRFRVLSPFGHRHNDSLVFKLGSQKGLGTVRIRYSALELCKYIQDSSPSTISLHHKSMAFSMKGDSNYFRLCRPHRALFNYSPLLLQWENSQKQHVNKWECLGAN